MLLLTVRCHTLHLRSARPRIRPPLLLTQSHSLTYFAPPSSFLKDNRNIPFYSRSQFARVDVTLPPRRATCAAHASPPGGRQRAHGCVGVVLRDTYVRMSDKWEIEAQLSAMSGA